MGEILEPAIHHRSAGPVFGAGPDGGQGGREHTQLEGGRNFSRKLGRARERFRRLPWWAQLEEAETLEHKLPGFHHLVATADEILQGREFFQGIFLPAAGGGPAAGGHEEWRAGGPRGRPGFS